MSKQQLQCVLISTMTVDIIPGAVADIEKAKQVFTGEADELAGEMMDKVLERVASFATVHSVSTATRTRPAGASVLANCLTEELRDRGYAVVIFGPNELGNQDAESLENELVQTGNERIDMTAREVGGCEDKEPQPSPEQMAAIQRFKDMHGATWKEDLMDCWLKAAYPRNYSDTHWLQQVRNQFGPEWLEKQ